MSRYLSRDWLAVLGDEVARRAEVREAAAGHTLAVTQVVTDGPEGDVTYHLEIANGTVAFGPGPATAEDVRFVQDWETAVAVATGTTNAQEAFLRGRIKLAGNQRRLVDAQPVLAVLEKVLAPVREATTYA
ncbi:MAG TPA: SCP2 sterol-binding domain-containing protein [Acidimicrobiales bacterium]